MWARVRREATLLKDRGHTVRVFSSHFTKGSDAIAPSKEEINGISIRRFSASMPGKGALKYLPGGESYMFWDFKQAMREALEFNPDVIIAHSYRHPHTLFALRLAKKVGAKVFLVTHAPFARETSRGLIEKGAVWFYDVFIGRHTLQKFDKIIAISHWEIPYLHALGIKESRIAIIPNGISPAFFENSSLKEKRILLYTGRLAPIKNLELVINALARINDSRLTFLIRGPGDADYISELRARINEHNLNSRVTLVNQSYTEKEQIPLLGHSQFFILASKSEGMPQVLIEALARGKIVIASDNPGNADIIRHAHNGFLFHNNNEEDLVRILNHVTSLSIKQLKLVQKRARATAEHYRWSKLIHQLEKVLIKKK